MRLEHRMFASRFTTCFGCLSVSFVSLFHRIDVLDRRRDGLAWLMCTVLHYRWSMGSALFLASWAVLMGPVTYAQHLISGPRLPFTVAYLGSIALTLFFAVKVSGRSPLKPPMLWVYDLELWRTPSKALRRDPRNDLLTTLLT